MPSTKSVIRSSLEKLGVYRRLKHSSLYDWYWTAVGGEHADVKRREKHFYRRLLPSGGRSCLVFDIGANEGAKTRVFLELSARVVAVDPDPEIIAFSNRVSRTFDGGARR